MKKRFMTLLGFVIAFVFLFNGTVYAKTTNTGVITPNAEAECPIHGAYHIALSGASHMCIGRVKCYPSGNTNYACALDTLFTREECACGAHIYFDGNFSACIEDYFFDGADFDGYYDYVSNSYVMCVNYDLVHRNSSNWNVPAWRYVYEAGEY